MAFEIGDKVMMNGLRSPRMIVVGEIEKDGERLLECLWFSNNMVEQRATYAENLLASAGNIRIHTALADTRPRLVYVNPDQQCGIKIDENGDILF